MHSCTVAAAALFQRRCCLHGLQCWLSLFDCNTFASPSAPEEAPFVEVQQPVVTVHSYSSWRQPHAEHVANHPLGYGTTPCTSVSVSAAAVSVFHESTAVSKHYLLRIARPTAHSSLNSYKVPVHSTCASDVQLFQLMRKAPV